VGNEGRHLIRQPDINQPSFGVLHANAALPAPHALTTNQLRPYLDNGFYVQSDSTSIQRACKSTQRRKGDFMARSANIFEASPMPASLGAHSDNPAVRRFH